MVLFDTVSFGPNDVRAVMGDSERKLPRCQVMAVLTSQTCGEPCWHAREEVCRCSCGGRNHGCLLIPGGERPERTAKIDGERYTLLAVGLHSDLYSQAREINGRPFLRFDSSAQAGIWLMLNGWKCHNENQTYTFWKP